MIRAICMLSLVLSPLFLTAKEPPKWKERDFLTVRLQDNGKALLNPGMGWTMFTDFHANWGPIVYKTALEENISQPADSGYVCHGDFYWDEPVLEILREYLPD